jgi:hypothetical protein
MVDVPIVYRNNGPWGAGKGAPLTSEEGDQNLAALVTALNELNLQSPVEIAAINVSDNQMTIVMEDYTVFGPFTLPVASFAMRGAWTPDTLYARNDLFTATVDGVGGLYMANRAFTSPSGAFNPNSGDMQGPFQSLLVPYQTLFDIGFFYPAQPGYGIGDEYTEDVEQPMFNLLSARAFHFLENAPGSLAKLDVGPASLLELRVLKNDTDIGVISFASGETDGTITLTTTDFAAGDMLRVYRPEVIDDTAYNLTVTLVGVIGAAP